MTASATAATAEATPMSSSSFKRLLREGARYFGASGIALALDAGIYIGLIRLFGVHHLVAAPAGFAVGVIAIYLLSTRWVFTARRFRNPRLEFALFAGIGIAGMGINQLVIYATVDGMHLVPEAGKFISAGIVFTFNFVTRKLLLFTRAGEGQ